MEMVRRNVRRIADIQSEVGDIMKDRQGGGPWGLAALVEQYADRVALVAAQEARDPRLAARVRDRLREALGLDAPAPEILRIAPFVRERIEALAPLFAHRDVRIEVVEDAEGSVCMPGDHFAKIVDGLIRNGVENTPDGGEIVVSVSEKGTGAMLAIHDFGVGIPEAFQQRIFEGLFPVQEPTAYSTGKPFDFNAGGKGLDLLRIRIFSEKYGFSIRLSSRYCPHAAARAEGCPGAVSRCEACTSPEDCRSSSDTRVELIFSGPGGCA
jgi:signal transduction histidine kinase